MSLLEDLHSVLTATKAVELGLPKAGTGVIVISADAKLNDAVALLQKHNISSCPVLRSGSTDPKAPFDQAYAGVIDLLDIVSFVLDILKQTENWGKGFETVLEAVIQFGQHTVQDILNKHPVSAFQSVPDTASLFDIIQLLGKDGFHRVIVVDNQSRMTNMLTQSGVLNFLVKKLSGNAAFDAFVKRPLTDVGLTADHPIIGLPITNNAADAFHLIQKCRVSGVPVLSKAGSLQGNISARDIRSMVGAAEKFDRLFDTVSEFMYDISQDKQSEAKPTSKPKAIVVPVVQTVARDDSIEFLLHLLAHHHIHRAYVVRGRVAANGTPIREPVAVVTLTDVMRALISGTVGADNERVSEGANLQYSAK